MVETEKTELNDMTGQENPIEEEKGGDVQNVSSDKPEEVTQEEVTQEEAIQEEAIQEEVIQEEVIQEEVIQEEVIQEEVIQEKITTETKSDVPENMEFEDNEYSDEEYQRYVDLYDQTLSEISPGQIVMGRILAITEQDVLIDIGFKSEGTIPLEEFDGPENVKVGDKVEVFLESLEDADGQLVLSKRKANFVRLWDNVVDTHNQGGTIEGVCMRRIKGGIVVDLNGVDAFLPGSQIDVKPIRDFDSLIGKTYTFKIVKVNKLRKNIVVSRRALLEESMAEQRESVLDNLKKGETRTGSVKNITDFGVFVDLGGVDGLLHINDLSWGRVNHPSEVVKLDEEIEVVILDYNDAKDRISLGMKQLQAHPWDDIEKKYPSEAVVKGKVVSIADYGAFVELEKGVEGLIHVSEMSWTRHGIHPSKMVNIGEVVEVKILNIDRERKRISLGLKQLTPDPWENIEEKYPLDSKYKGRVRNMTNFGVFVEMEEGIDGLIHISDLSWTRKIKHPSEVLKRGEEIEVVVLDVNKDERRVSLGYKQLTEDPWQTFEEAYKVDTKTNAKVVRFVDKGLIVELPLGLEGFVPLSQMDEPTMAKVTESIKVEDEIECSVIEFDRENKRVVLSRKQLIEKDKKKKGDDEKAEVEAYMDKQKGEATLGEIVGEESVKEEKDDKAEKKDTAKKTKDKTKKSEEKESPEKSEPEVEAPKEEERPQTEMELSSEPKEEVAESLKKEKQLAADLKAEEPEEEVEKEGESEDSKPVEDEKND